MGIICNIETIVDDNNIEMVVEYEYEKTSSQVEEGHGYHDVGNMIYTTLKTVELIIAGVGIDIISTLNDRQKNFIISKLSYE